MDGDLLTLASLNLQKGVRWQSGRSEMVCLTPEGSGLICDEELAVELGVPVLVMLPNAKALVERLE